MQKFIFFIIAVLIVLAVVVILSFWPPKETLVEKPQESQEIEKVFLTVGDKSLNFDYEQGITAFDLLEKSGLEIETKQYDFGIFIESIDSVKNGQDNKYWLYYVNNESPSVAADKMELRAGDKVEFRFEESPF